MYCSLQLLIVAVKGSVQHVSVCVHVWYIHMYMYVCMYVLAYMFYGVYEYICGVNIHNNMLVCICLYVYK